jgi:hypothetical protein
VELEAVWGVLDCLLHDSWRDSHDIFPAHARAMILEQPSRPGMVELDPALFEETQRCLVDSRDILGIEPVQRGCPSSVRVLKTHYLP